MNKSPLVLICILGLFPGCVSSDDQSRRDRIIEYFEIAGLLESIKNQVELMKVGSRDASSGWPPEIWEDERVVLAFDKYESDLLEAYVDVAYQNLSDDDLEFLFRVLETEDGRRMMDMTRRLRPHYDAATLEPYEAFIDRLNSVFREYAP